MKQLEKLTRGHLSNQVEEELLRYVQERPIMVGDKIPNEFELAEKFGTGRSTIREAVKSLVSKGDIARY